MRSQSPDPNQLMPVTTKRKEWSTHSITFHSHANLSESVLMQYSHPKRHLLARDLPDKRDYVYKMSAHEARQALPKRVDLRPKCSPVWDQGKIGTCTAHAVAAAFAYEQRLQGMRAIDPSRLFIFYNERALSGQKGIMPVLHLRDALKAVAKRGVCHESLWPYSEDLNILKRKPHKYAFSSATTKKVFEYHRIPHSHKPAVLLKHIKHCLANGSPIVLGIALYASFETAAVMRSAVMPVPDTEREEFRGGHAVMAVGYDDQKKAVLIRNSWGRKWGERGYFWMPYKLITNPKLAHDFWTIRGVVG